MRNKLADGALIGVAVWGDEVLYLWTEADLVVLEHGDHGVQGDVVRFSTRFTVIHTEVPQDKVQSLHLRLKTRGSSSRASSPLAGALIDQAPPPALCSSW